MNFKNLLKKFNFENLDKTLDKIEKGFVTFQRGLNSFNKGMDNMMNELKSDFEKQDARNVKRETRNKQNLDKIWGNSNHTKIWSDKKSNESLF